MNTNLKKILIILVIVLILALIAFLIYNFFFKKPAEEKPGGPGKLPKGKEGEITPPGEEGKEITPAPKAKIISISAERVLAPTLSADKTKVIYYAQSNGNVWQSGFDGSDLTKISSTVLNNLVDAIWSPTKTKVISVYRDDWGNTAKYCYDYETGKASPLNPFIKETTWSPNGDKILFQYTNEAENNNHIGISKPDNTSWEIAYQTKMSDINLDWLGTKNEIAFYEKPSGLVYSDLFLYDLSTKKLTELLSKTSGTAVKWSPQGDKFIYSKTDNKGRGLSLYVSSKDGLAQANTNAPTFVEKCTWSQDNRTAFCAVPKNITGAETFPDDFYKGVFSSDDDFWKINLETAETTPLIESWEKPEEEIYDAVDLFLSPLEDYLFFVNKKNGLLYSIEL